MFEIGIFHGHQKQMSSRVMQASGQNERIKIDYQFDMAPIQKARQDNVVNASLLVNSVHKYFIN